MKIFTNRHPGCNYVANAFEIEKNEYLYFATAFFTDNSELEKLLKEGCNIKLIVRLGFPTSPTALNAILNGKYKNQIEIRYFASHYFHPKLYIFGSRKAIVGSANFTQNALYSNQEVVIEIDGDNETFSNLKQTFSDYWDEAKVLDEHDLKIYSESFTKFNEIQDSIQKLTTKIESKIGHKFENNFNTKVRPNKNKLYLKEIEKTYSEYTKATNQLIDIYRETGRIEDDESFPLSLEVDLFISYIREEYVGKSEPCQLGFQSNIEIVKNHISTWKEVISDEHSRYRAYLFDRRDIIYPSLQKSLGSESCIRNSSIEQIIDAILHLNAVVARTRHFPDGLIGLKKYILQKNSEEDIKISLIHLLYGKGKISNRICDLLYGEYKIKEFGMSLIEELVGWMGIDNLPIINGRVTYVLKYYGFDVVDYGK